MAARRPTLAVTMGDPAGIGPEIVARAASNPAARRAARLVIVGEPEVMERALSRLRSRVRLRPVDLHTCDLREDAPGLPLIVSSEQGWRAIEPGHPTAASGMMAARAI
jgi:4-hydroxy-L-threonine phosphate dehydrogenase PdxA